MRRRWSDVIGEGDQVTFHLVDPTPPYLERNVAAHVLLVPNPPDKQVTSLLTIFDHSHEGAEKPSMRIAIPPPMSILTSMISSNKADLGVEEERHFRILFTNDEEDIPSEQAAVLHATSTVPKGELDYMRIPYQLGCEKAVALQILHISEDFIEVTFCQYKGTLQESPGCNRIQKPWPPPQSVKPIGFMTPLLSHDPQPACHLQLGLTAEELNQFFSCLCGPRTVVQDY